jgi:hypothetical protein
MPPYASALPVAKSWSKSLAARLLASLRSLTFEIGDTVAQFQGRIYHEMAPVLALPDRWFFNQITFARPRVEMQQEEFRARF